MSKEKDFRNSLKIELLSDNVKDTDYIDKVALNVYDAVLNTEPENQKEEMKQLDLLHNINKFIYEYEEDAELRKILADYEYLKKYRKIQPKER